MTDRSVVLGGYLRVPRVARKQWQPGPLPERYLSLSRCLTEVEHGADFLAWHTDVVAARRFRGSLLTIAFIRDDIPDLVREMADEIGPDRTGHVAHRLLELFGSGTPLPADTELRGFEVIGIVGALGSVHSWLCHGFEADAARVLGVRTNRWGLIPTGAEASAVLEWMLNRPPEDAPEPAYWTVAGVAEGPDAPAGP